MKRLLRILGLRELAGAVACSMALAMAAAPRASSAQMQVFPCTYEGGSATTAVTNRPTFVECDSSHNLQVNVVAGTVAATFPYAGTNAQTLTAASFLGVGALDAGGKFSPLQEDASQNLLAKINVALPAGTAIIGKFGIDQTTPGTTNGVQLTAGTAIAGKVGIDQTTPGTTNGVQLTAGTAIAGKVGIDQTTPGTTNGVQLTAGTAIAGKVGIDQTTPGTTNGVQLTAGTAIAGKVGIDQTTPGTTNGVQVNAALPAGSNTIGSVTPLLPYSGLTTLQTLTANSFLGIGAVDANGTFSRLLTSKNYDVTNGDNSLLAVMPCDPIAGKCVKVTATNQIQASVYDSAGHAIAASAAGTSIANATTGTLGVQGITTGVPMPVVQGKTTTILTSGSATSCTSIQAAAGTLVSITNPGSATTVFPAFYNDAATTCATGTRVWGNFTSVTLGAGQTITLNIPLSAGLAYKISGALSDNLVVVTN